MWPTRPNVVVFLSACSRRAAAAAAAAGGATCPFVVRVLQRHCTVRVPFRRSFVGVDGKENGHRVCSVLFLYLLCCRAEAEHLPPRLCRRPLPKVGARRNGWLVAPRAGRGEITPHPLLQAPGEVQIVRKYEPGRRRRGGRCRACGNSVGARSCQVWCSCGGDGGEQTRFLRERVGSY